MAEMKPVPVETLNRIAAVLEDPKAEHPHDVSYLIEEVRSLAASPQAPARVGVDAVAEFISDWFDRLPGFVDSGNGTIRGGATAGFSDVEFDHIALATDLLAALTPREEADDLTETIGRIKVLANGEEAPAEGAGRLADMLSEKLERRTVALDAALAELEALRARTSEPEAGAVAWTGSGSLARIKDKGYGFQGYIYGTPDAAHPIALYTHPSPATADKLREETERLVTFGTALCTAADHYGVKHLDSDDMDNEAVQLQAATMSMRHVLTDAAEALATLSPKEEGGE